MNIPKKKIILVTLVAIVLVTLIAGIALAQAGDENSQGLNGPPALFQAFLGKLAANLGIGQDKLQQAIRQAEQQMVDEAVQQGKITPEQAEKIKTRLQNNPGSFGFIREGCPGAGKGKGWPAKGANLETLAQTLGLSVDELKAQLKEGKKLADIAEQQGVSMDQIHQKMQEARIQNIQQAVKEGRLTQEQADRHLQRTKDMQDMRIK
jgi:predicted DNA-binding protein (UPF0251 family)